ncbi:MAG: hypothetical protein Ct9H90mP18_01900 [Gammaproteobacteria bacterium]|nr:MAG: hypothetical protein Ct9H90mP18_01900 [Gammaproteobacteria bacterium]
MEYTSTKFFPGLTILRSCYSEWWRCLLFWNVRSFFPGCIRCNCLFDNIGAVAERMKLWPFLLFCVFMTSIIYPVQGYWKWGGGFLDAAGFSDFAGSGVVIYVVLLQL